MSVKEAAIKAMERIGTSNGHAVPQSQDPIVSVVHEYHVATLGESHFKARRDKAKKQLEKSVGVPNADKIDAAVASVKKHEQGTSVELVSTEHYNVQVDFKNGASFLDTQKLKVELARKHKMLSADIEQLFEECTDRRDPSQSWKVVEK